jgi:hypothetical protein
MPTDHILSALSHALDATGLGDFPGKVLYSGLETLKPGKLLVLGLNPGGDPAAETASARSHLASAATRGPGWNEYLDVSWRPGGRLYPPGQAPMQRRVSCLLEGLGFNVRSVCASNLIFVRSTGVDTLQSWKDLGRLCWPVHKAILEVVRPECIVSLGDDVLDFIAAQSGQARQVESYPSGHGAWNCKHSRVDLLGRETSIISLPHPGRYAIDHHPEVISWMRSQIEK